MKGMMKMKKYFVFFIVVALLVLVLGGCGVPRITTPDQPHREVDQPPKVEAVVDEPVVKPVAVASNSEEFKATKKMLLERGILKEDTPVYRGGEFVETNQFHYTLERFFWSRHEIIVTIGFFGVEENEGRGIINFRTRLVINDREYFASVVAMRGEGDYPTISSYFPGREIIKPGVDNYVLVFTRMMISSEEELKPGSRRIEAREGEVAFILMLEDIEYSY